MTPKALHVHLVHLRISYAGNNTLPPMRIRSRAALPTNVLSIIDKYSFYVLYHEAYDFPTAVDTYWYGRCVM